jgi:Delta24-sterol reductase
MKSRVVDPISNSQNLIENKILHTERIRTLQDEIKEINKKSGNKKIVTSRTHQESGTYRNTNIYKNINNKVKMDFKNIVKLDTKNMNITVEPRINMDELLSFLIPKGYSIPVVPELAHLTVGGLISGAGIESSSYKYGYFHDTCLEYEIILGDGSILKVNQKNKPDLFNTIPGSYGTIGIITLVKIMIVKTLKYVKLSYIDINEENFQEKLEIVLKQGKYDFMDGILFNPNKGYIVCANMTDNIPNNKRVYIDLWYKNFYYENIQEKKISYMDLYDYYFRYDRGIFWLFNIYLKNTRRNKFLFGWLRAKYKKYAIFNKFKNVFRKKRTANNTIVQDALIPLNKAKEFYDLVQPKLKVYPVWICVCKNILFNSTEANYILNKHVNTPFYVDIGFYGKTPKKEESLRFFEQLTLKYKGFTGHYGTTYYTRKELYSTINYNLYKSIRKKYGAEERFPDIYDKIGHSK